MFDPAADCGLPADAVAAYRRLARHEDEPCDESALDVLHDWGLAGGETGMPVALEPQGALRRRMSGTLVEKAAQLARIAEELQRTALLPTLADALRVDYEAGEWRTSAGSRFLDDPAEVNARIADVVAGAQHEILSAQPGGPRTMEHRRIAEGRDTDALQRGVRLLTLYRDTVRTDAVTAGFAQTMTGRGAQYRTVTGPFERCIVVDRKHAFISNYVVEGAPEHSAWHVTDRASVAWIARAWEAEWRRAEPWSGQLRSSRSRQAAADAGEGKPRTTRRQREILRDLVEDIPQTRIAERLHISPRTLSDEIAAVKELFGVSTLAALGHRWALSPDRHVDDDAPATGAGAGVGPAAA